MSKHQEYIKYGLYAIGAYVAYKYVLPMVESGFSSLESNLSNFTNNLTSSLPVNRAFVPATTTVNSVPYAITNDDRLSMLAQHKALTDTWANWTNLYNTVKGITLPIAATDVGFTDTQQLTLDQYISAVNAHYPSATGFSGLAGNYGLQLSNGWVGVQ